MQQQCSKSWFDGTARDLKNPIYLYIYILDEIKQFPTQNWLTTKTWCHTATKDMVDITATKTCFHTKSKYVMFIYIYIYTTGRPKRDSLKMSSNVRHTFHHTGLVSPFCHFTIKVYNGFG